MVSNPFDDTLSIGMNGSLGMNGLMGPMNVHMGAPMPGSMGGPVHMGPGCPMGPRGPMNGPMGPEGPRNRSMVSGKSMNGPPNKNKPMNGSINRASMSMNNGGPMSSMSPVTTMSGMKGPMSSMKRGTSEGSMHNGPMVNLQPKPIPVRTGKVSIFVKKGVFSIIRSTYRRYDGTITFI